MKSLKEELLNGEHQLIVEKKKNERKPTAKELGLLNDPRTRVLSKKEANGRSKLLLQRGVGRPTKDYLASVSSSRQVRAERGLCQLFRPSWQKFNFHQRSKGLISHTHPDLGSLIYDAGAVLNSKINGRTDLLSEDEWSVREPQTPVLTEQMTEAVRHYKLRAHNGPSGVYGFTPLTTVIAEKPKPKIKTYTRKKKTNIKTETEPVIPETTTIKAINSERINLFPPCYPTLVGFRGLTLLFRSLLAAADPRSGTYIHKQTQSVNGVLYEGIFHTDIMYQARKIDEQEKDSILNGPQTEQEANASVNDPQTVEDEEGTISEAEADELLFERFKSLFLWSAVACSVKPNVDAATAALITRNKRSLKAGSVKTDESEGRKTQNNNFKSRSWKNTPPEEVIMNVEKESKIPRLHSIEEDEDRTFPDIIRPETPVIFGEEEEERVFISTADEIYTPVDMTNVVVEFRDETKVQRKSHF